MQKKILIAAGVLVFLVAGFYLSEGEGEKEFKKQMAALDTVKSWKMDLQISRNGHLVARRTDESQCPDMEHITESGIESEGEFVRMADLVYYRQNGGKWVQDANTPKDLFLPILSPRPCMSNPGGTTTSPDSGDVEWRTELKRAIKKGSFQKGGTDTIGGAKCRDWQVSWINDRNQMVAYTMCINEQDHLPRRIQMARESVNMYFTWNVPVEVKIPDTTPRETVTPAYPSAPGVLGPN